jgi:4-amino-4-deoxy-L-arabinose transferase-like glycosyltransferase
VLRGTLVKSLRDGAWIWVPVVVALALRLGFVAASPHYNPIVHDDGSYNHLACVVGQRGAYPRYDDPALHATAYRPPVYPYFLGGIYHLTGCDPEISPTTTTAWPRIAGGIVGTFAVAMVAWLAARWWGRRAGFAAGLLAAIFGPAIVVGSQLLSEQLFVALMLAAIVAVIRIRDGRNEVFWAVVAGLAAGLLTLTRTNGGLLVPVLAAGAWIGRPRFSWRAARVPVLLVAVAVLTVAPWTVRNAREVHAFIPVSDESGGTLAGTYNDAARTDRDAPGAWKLPESVPQYHRLFHEAQRLDLPETTLQSRLRDRALTYAREHPGYVAEVGLYNTLRLTGAYGHDDLRADARSLRLPEWSFRIAWSTSEFLVLLALVGVVSGAARRPPRFVWVAGLLLFVSTVFVNAEALRFQVPFGVFEALLGGAGVAWLLRTARGRTRALVLTR